MAKKRKRVEGDPNFDPDPALYDPPRSKTLFGVAIRSKVAHGKVVALVHPPLPSGFTLVQSKDIPGNQLFQVYKSRVPFLNDEEVQYQGEAMALLAGPTEEAVRALAEKVRYVTRKLTLEEFAETLPQLKQKELSSGQPPSAVVENPESPPLRPIEGIYTTGAQDHGNLDPVEVLANVQGADVYLKVRTQWPGNVVGNVARALDVESAKVRVLSDVTSGVQNSQVWFPSLLAVYAALLSQATGKPVRMRLSKEEEFLLSPKRPESRILLRSHVDPRGRIVHLNADVVVQVGAYGVLEEEVLDRVLIGALAPYRLGGYQVNAHLELSHTPPRGPVGGLGEALGLFALESHIDDICFELDLDTLTWRLDNALQKDQIAFNGAPFKVDAPLVRLLPQLGKATDFSRKHSAFHLLESKRREFLEEALPLRGIGVAAGFQGNGFTGAGLSPVTIETRLESDGKLSLYIPLVTANERQVKVWKEIAAAALQMSVKDVRICPVVTGEHPTGGPSVASRAFEIVPRLILQTCEGIAQRRFRQPLPITVRKVFRRTKAPAWETEDFTGQPFLSFSWGAAVAEVEVLPLLAEVKIKKITLVVEAGARIDEAAARNALTEGVQLGVGWAMTENAPWEKLTLSHSTFLKYQLPGPCEIPSLEIHFLDGLPGALPKGLGSLGAHLSAPAVLAAVRQALGRDLRSLPIQRKMLDESLRAYET